MVVRESEEAAYLETKINSVWGLGVSNAYKTPKWILV